MPCKTRVKALHLEVEDLKDKFRSELKELEGQYLTRAREVEYENDQLVAQLREALQEAVGVLYLLREPGGFTRTSQLKSARRTSVMKPKRRSVAQEVRMAETVAGSCSIWLGWGSSN